jgi:hypothetical protein
MQRAAILIGVGKSGLLPPLPGATAAVRQMADWLTAQGVAADRISVLTDDVKPVRAHEIKDAVAAQLAHDDLDQIIVYFSGHGVNLRYSEYWLLSHAPSDTQAAVNVEGSIVLARQCGVPHVVFISDACRTAPEGLKAQYVTGSEIFPNDGDDDATEAPVDVFFACALGKPALEIRDPNESAKAYTSAYTSALVAALNGQTPTLLERAREGGQQIGFVRPRPLGAYLRTELPKRLLAAKVTTYTQLPHARITSDEAAWLSMLRLDDTAPRVERATGLARRTPSPNPSLDSTVQRLVNETVAAPQSSQAAPQAPPASPRIGPSSPASAMLSEATARNREPFGPTHFETQCGFKVRGAVIRDARSTGVNLEVVGNERELVRVHAKDERAVNAFIEFEDGTSVLLPAVPQFVCALSFEDGELANVSYEPSEGSNQWVDYQARQRQMRSLRALIAAAARLGVFRLDESNGPAVAESIRYMKGFDPTMAVFAAYAFNDLRMHSQIQQMYDAMRNDMHLRLFDVAMVAHRLGRDLPEEAALPVGPFPLLAQGWALLRAYGVEMSSLLTDLERCLVPSLWTLFDAQGSSRLREALMQGEIK